MNKTVLITGVAGFIGSHLAEKMLQSDNYTIVGIDNLNDYYDVELKKDRLSKLSLHSKFTFVMCDISDTSELSLVFNDYQPIIVINLAAQAGVRYSIENPDSYVKSNVIGFYNILELCRSSEIEHLLYASSSSVYGENEEVPFSESDKVENPVSLYAATKKSNELFANAYSNLYDFPSTGLRFFTVYGPNGRPDMAYFGFVDKFFNNEEIKIFNNGDFENDLYRDFTYIDDIVDGIISLIDKPSYKENGKPKNEIFNIGNNTPVKLTEFIDTLEECLCDSLGRKIEFKRKYEPIKPGDVPATYANIDKLKSKTGFQPSTSLKSGLKIFTDWYVHYYSDKIKMYLEENKL